ncbi:MAG: hypothetical protein AABZ08_00305 [Planctomycetota bacterium]
MIRICSLIIIGAALALSAGCAVPQQRGGGQYMHVQEPMTKAWYHLYLPVDYVKNSGKHPNPKMKRWPLVMTFHGMKPYDNALPQEREWEHQADIYGYIVCAPELRTCDSFMEYPITREHDYVLEDKRNVIAIMDHIYSTTYADPKRVLSTSWSCGGYLAHYFPNRFPDRFTCIATRLSNFSPKILIEETVPIYRDKTSVAVYIGDGDFPKCKSESEEAVAWYNARGFRVAKGKMIDNMGHRRIPQTCAAFFAEQIGIEPIRPADAARSVAEVQMTEYYPPQDMLARMSPPSGPFIPSLASSTRTARQNGSANPMTPPVVPPTTGNLTTADQRPAPSTARPASTFANASAGRKYPTGRAPTYDPTPQSDEPREVAKLPTTPVSTPTKTASADRPRGNWLDPAKPPPIGGTEKPKPAANDNSTKIAQKPNATPPAAPKSSPPQERTKPVVKEQPRESALATNTPKPKSTAKEPVQLASTPKYNTSFTPQNAGRRDYDRLMDKPRESGTRSSTPAQTAPRTAKLASAPAVASPTGRKAQRVNIRITGPAIGTAPHYLKYSVDLPREKLEGADILWSDNGLWLGDEISGAKILESPGIHFITVLVVSRDDTEYRGQAKVQVLERAPTASTYTPGQRPG